MKYPKEYLDEIKTRLKVSTVVSKSVALKKRGKEYVGLSPFKMRKLHHLLSMMKKNFIIVLQHLNMAIFLIL
jgi:hypothetical protein